MEFSHSTNFVKLYKLFQEKKLTDTTLIAGEIKSIISCHKLVLMASSTYFEELFDLIDNHHEGKKDPTVVVLRDISHEFLIKILELIYCGKVNIPAHQISEFRNAAAYLKIKVEDNNEHQADEFDVSLHTQISQETMSQDTLVDCMSQETIISDDVIQDLSMNSSCLSIQEENINPKGTKSDASSIRNISVLLSRNKNLEIEPQLKKTKMDPSKIFLHPNYQR